MAGQPAEDDLGYLPGGNTPPAGGHIEQGRLALRQIIHAAALLHAAHGYFGAAVIIGRKAKAVVALGQATGSLVLLAAVAGKVEVAAVQVRGQLGSGNNGRYARLQGYGGWPIDS
jgi:hypothetical protein